MDYLEFWKLRQAPFEMDSDPSFFFESRAHGEALARLLYLVADQGMGMGMLTGEIGAGKTITLSVLKNRLRRDLYQVSYIRTASLRFSDLLQEINLQLREGPGQNGPPSVNGGTDPYRLLKEFEDLLDRRLRPMGKHFVLILDEAQLLDPKCLEEVKCLTNLNQDGRRCLTIILAGQPELRENLRLMPQIYQRLGIVFHLLNLSRDELAPYVTHRLSVAGSPRQDVFEDACLDELYVFSGGCPRQVNRICKLAVDRACLLQKTMVDADMVRMIIADIRKYFG